MIKKNIVILTILFSLVLSSEWINIQSSNIENPTFELVDSDINNTLINFNFDDFHLTDVQIDNKNYFTLDIKNGATSIQLGYPDLSHISKSIIIPDNASNILFEEALSEPVASANADTSCAFVIGFCVMLYPYSYI